MKKLISFMICISLATIVKATQTVSGVTIGQTTNPMATTPKTNANTTTSYPTTSSTSDLSMSAKVNDNQITYTLQNKFDKDPIFTNAIIRVTTINGIVYLEGSAKNQAQIDQALSTAKTMNGVKQVQSKVTISP